MVSDLSFLCPEMEPPYSRQQKSSQGGNSKLSFEEERLKPLIKLGVDEAEIRGPKGRAAWAEALL